MDNAADDPIRIARRALLQKIDAASIDMSNKSDDDAGQACMRNVTRAGGRRPGNSGGMVRQLATGKA